VAARTKAPAYGADSIQILEFPQTIRKRLARFVGAVGMPALYHVLTEVIDNAIDEVLAGVADKIEVVIHEDGSLSVTDNGRGIPPDMHPKEGVPTPQVVFCKLDAGGKFETDGAYKTSGGLHGVGVKTTNATAEWLQVDIWWEGVHFRQRFEDAEPVTGVQILSKEDDETVVGEVGDKDEAKLRKQNIQDRKRHGTIVHFMPDHHWLQIEEGEGHIDFGAIATRLREKAYLSPGLHITLRDEREDEQREEVYHYENGVEDYVTELVAATGFAPICDVIKIEGTPLELPDIRVEIAMQYVDDDATTEELTYVNNIFTPDGGTHLEGFRRALTSAIKRYGNDKGILEKKDNLSGDDVRSGLIMVLNLLMPEPQFSSQSKRNLVAPTARTAAQTITYEQLNEWLNKRKNTGAARKIVEQCRDAARQEQAFAKARRLAKGGEKRLGQSVLPGKLADVVRKRNGNGKGHEDVLTTCFIVEGDSAGGTCKLARDRYRHAILPLRGKIMNTQDRRLGSTLNSADIKMLITALGVMPGRKFHLSELRYDRVAILCDADDDGAHIATLLLTFFHRFMRPIITAGRLFIALAPLYQVTHRNGEIRYLYTHDELARIDWGKRDIRKIQRYKGLGEMSWEQLRETTLSPEGGKMIQVTMSNAVDTAKMFQTVMGRDSGARFDWLMDAWNEEDFVAIS
jgi:DNA gyrase subunit B